MKIAMLGNFQVDYTSETHHAKSLEALGHEVIRIQEPQPSGHDVYVQAANADLFVWIHTHGWETPGIELTLDTLSARLIPCVTFHLDLYMPIQRWRRYHGHPYFTNMDHWFTVDPLMADWISENTRAEGHFLPAGVFGPECYISDQPSPHANDVVFVGSRGYHEEWKWRPQLIDWLRETYGPRFTHVGGDGDTGTLRGDALNAMYANSKVAVGDTLCVNFDYPLYHSDRLFECPGRGGFSLFPEIRGLDEWFRDGLDIAFYKYGDFTGLKTLIDYYLEHDEEREQIRKAGHELVKNNHTYAHRWQSILETVGG
jgi:hypothetical protein